MQNPTEYLLTSGDMVSLAASEIFSCKPWGFDEALRRAQVTGKTQTVYKLVPVYRVEAKNEVVIKEITFAGNGA